MYHMVLEGKPERTGFQMVCVNESFKCAWITASFPYAYGRVNELKRHNESDEVFTLISGTATLLTGEPDRGEYNVRELGKGVSYCVTAGTWHYLAVSEDALVFVVENSRVSAGNTDVISVEEQNLYVEGA